MSVLKLVGVLLDYPREELWEHGEELLAACDDPALNATAASSCAASCSSCWPPMRWMRRRRGWPVSTAAAR
ncbi:hypothetical protein NJG12_12860 [Stenotrophomonas maltophilia]|nr:hypothetical protein [Stenotrophomonas maltophilia]MCO7496373.1 hypothetical protein [Stenotrophomonas maltophilia]